MNPAKFILRSGIALFLSSAVAFAAAEDEFAAQTDALVAATDAYFNQVESDAAEKRSPALTITRPELVQKTSAAAEDTESLTQNGPLRHLTGYRINWYPVDRLLGSVDFMGTWDGNRNLVCGYLIWDLTTPDAPVLHSVSANFVDLDDLRGKPAADIHRHLLDANCAHGALDDNHAFFEVTAQ